MTSRPLLMSAAMVRATLDGRKTVTRRIVKPQPPIHCSGPSMPSLTVKGAWDFGWPDDAPAKLRNLPMTCPYGVPGETRLWVRENYRAGMEWDNTKPSEIDPLCGGNQIRYEADGKFIEHSPRAGDTTESKPCRVQDGWGKLRPGIFMPRWASRITLLVKSIRVERVQDITEEDAVREGIVLPRCPNCGHTKADARFQMDHRICGLPEPVGAIDLFRELWNSINGPGAWERNDWVWRIEFERTPQ